MTGRNQRYAYLMPASGAGNEGNEWLRRHLRAIGNPRTEFERALVGMLLAWLAYADAHESAYGSTIGEDGVLGPQWTAIGAGLRGLLNGDLGELDGGTLDCVLCTVLTQHGFDPETL